MRSFACSVVLASLFLGGAVKAQTLTAGDPANTFNMVSFAKGLSAPTDLVNLPDGRTVITQRLGDVVVYQGGIKAPAGHIAVNATNGEQGLLGVVADPNFFNNHFLYFYADIGGTADKHQIVRYVLSPDGMINAPTVILGTGGPTPGIMGPANHNGGGMIIYNNQLYLGVGDTGANATPPQNKFGSCLNQANGKILRINLDGSIPTDNPLNNIAQVTACSSTTGAFTTAPPDKRIYAWGLRNPFRLWIDPAGTQAGTMWIGDVGETTREEISVGKGDQHYGYPFQEGTTDWGPALLANECMGVSPARACTPAVYDYPHTNGNNCIIGGLIPSGCGWDATWTSRYFFGDFGSGNVWTIDVNAGRTGVVGASSVKTFASLSGPASFRMGADNALYIVEVSGGAVERIVPKNQAALCGGSTDAGTPPADAGKDASSATGAGGSAGVGGNGNAGNSGTGGTFGTGGQGGVPGAGGSGNVGTGAGGDAMGAAGVSSGTGIPGGSGASVGSGGASGVGSPGLTDDSLTIQHEGACVCGSPGRRTGSAGAAAAVGLALVTAHRARRKRTRSKAEPLGNTRRGGDRA